MKIKIGRAGRYVAEIKTDRNVRTIDLRTTDEQRAKEIALEMNLEQIERASIAGAITRELVKKLARGTLQVGDAVDRWYVWAKSTYESENSTTNMLCYIMAWMRDTGAKHLNIDEITEDDLDRWVNQKDGRKASTRKFRLACLRSLFIFCKSKGYIDSNVAELCCVKYKDLDHEQKEVRIKRSFTDEEYSKVLEYLRGHIRVLLHRDGGASEEMTETYRFWLAATIIGRHSALRLSDIANLQWASIKGERLVVHTDKRNTRVDIEINPELREGLDMIVKENPKWCWPKWAIIASDPRKRSQLPGQFARILKRAGVGDHHFHELRSTKLTELHNAGSNIVAIAEFAGHTSTKTTEGYITK
jgi:integrase